MDKYLPNFKNCLEKEIPFCQARCPFHPDIHSFIEKMQRQGFNAAYKNYRNAVGFPGIVTGLCPQYCKDVCPMDEPVEMHLLEQAALEYAKRTDPPDYNLPKKNGHIAIIGGGLSGLGCALRLTTKKYDVTIYEKAGHVGGRALDLIDVEKLNAELEKQFQFEEYRLMTDMEITDPDDLAGYDAVYVATGESGYDFDILKKSGEEGNGDPCLLIGNTGFFAGGGLLGKDLMNALADGLAMGTTIDNFLKTGNLIYTPEHSDTMCHLDENKVLDAPAVKPSGTETSTGYTKEEAAAEASRCLRCQCDSCRTFCDLTDYYNRWPVRIRDEIQATTLPGYSELKATPAKRLINTCTQCGLCKEVCPEDIDLGGLILEARKSMHRQEKMAPAYNEFFLRDMDFTNGPLAAMAKPAPGKTDCRYAFFPGCQLGASDPELVIRSYGYILSQDPEAGMFLSCCGIPAEWAGDDDLLNRELSRMNTTWEELGRPVLILACPTCGKFISKHLPGIETVFLYDYMAGHGIECDTSKSGLRCVFDPCSTRGDDTVRTSVRKLAENAGYDLESLPIQEGHSACCSYGGHNSIAAPEFADQVADKRIGEKDLPYIAYCINCRDAFLARGKDTLHILDVLFDRTPVQTTATARRENRVILKETLLKKFWGEEMKEKKEKYAFTMSISDELREKLDAEHIIEDDMYNVIGFCLRTGRFVRDGNNVCSGYRQIGHGTFWAEFTVDKKTADEKSDDHVVAVTLVNGYSHRMEIELEEVWNGHKIKIDL
ncbi:MAG: NAD(P)-binding protein [Eubacteriaceae bacterium]|nr:NAD(P)-binding protein [Eubacteriaceae bacterium]